MKHDEKEYIWNSFELIYNTQQKDPNKFNLHFIIVSNDNHFKLIIIGEKIIRFNIEKNWNIINGEVSYKINSNDFNYVNELIKPFIREIKLESIG